MRVTEEDRSLPTVDLTCRETANRCFAFDNSEICRIIKRESSIKVRSYFIKVRSLILCRVPDFLLASVACVCLVECNILGACSGIERVGRAFLLSRTPHFKR